MKEKLISEWDYENNGSIDPCDIPDHSNKKYYWRCPQGHPSYYASVNHRANGQSCPVCSNHKIIKGINDFDLRLIKANDLSPEALLNLL